MTWSNHKKRAVSLLEVLVTTALFGFILVVASDFGQALLNTKKFSAEKDRVSESVTTGLRLIKEDLQFATTVLAPDPDSIENGLALESLMKEHTFADSERFYVPPLRGGDDGPLRWESLDYSHLEIHSYELDGDFLVRSTSEDEASLFTASNFSVERVGDNYFKISVEVSRVTRTQSYQLRVMKL